MKDPLARRFFTVLQHCEALFPQVFSQLTQLHLQRGTPQLDLDWPQWCFTPTDLAVQVLDMHAQARPHLYGFDERVRAHMLHQMPPLVSALAAWKVGKYVHRFDPDLLEALERTSIRGHLPGALFERLPAWCIYIELPGGRQLAPALFGQDYPLHGVWAYLDWTLEEEDPAQRVRRLQLVLDTSPVEGIFSVGLRLDCPLEEALHEFITGDLARGLTPKQQQGLDALRQTLSGVLSTLLYLCALNADYTPPTRPNARTVRRSVYEHQVQPVIHEVGVRIGAMLRAAQAAAPAASGPPATGELRSVTPHLRGTHWQTYWTGPKTMPQVPVVKWKAPILVGFDLDQSDDLPVVIRPVKA